MSRPYQTSNLVASKDYIFLDPVDKLTLDAMIGNGESVNTMASVLFHTQNTNSATSRAAYYTQNRDACASLNPLTSAEMYSQFVSIRDTVARYVEEKKQR